MPDVKSPPFGGDYSRSTFVEQKKYLGYLQQQGAEVVDADLIDQAQISVFLLKRAMESAFPSQAYGDAFKIVQHPNPSLRGNNFFVYARREAGDRAIGVSPDTYAKMSVRGLLATLSDSDPVDEGYGFDVGTPSAPASDLLLLELFHQSTTLQDGSLIDENALFTPGEFIGWTLVPNVKSGTAFTVTGNTTTEIQVAGGGMLAVAATGDFYRLVPPAPTGSDRTDLIWLDVYIGEADEAEDPNLLHPFSGGVVTSRRLVLRQQIRVSGGASALPYGEFYEDGRGTVHYAVPLALIERPDGVTDITDALITDLRDPHLGSSREVAAARGDFDSLGERLDAIDPEVATRHSARTAQETKSISGYQNIVQVTGTVYVGETPGDDISEIVKLLTPDGKHYLKAAPASIISTLEVGATNPRTGGPAYEDLTGEDLQVEVGGVALTINFTNPADIDEVVDQINAAVGASALSGQLVALVVNGKQLALRITDGTWRGSLRVKSASAALPFLFLAEDETRYAAADVAGDMFVDNTREPRLRKIGAFDDPTVDTDIRGAGDFAPNAKFSQDPYLEFDALLTGSLAVRYGVAVLFKSERADIHHRRGAWDPLSDEDKRLELEHYADGQHRDDAIKTRHIDWGLGSEQVKALDMPAEATGDLTDTTVQGLLNELESGKLSRGGSSAARTMLADLLMNGFRISGLPQPASPTEAATKDYVDNLAVGVIVIDPVRVASTGANLDLGATGDLLVGDTIDGVVLASGDRVLVKDQTDPLENGVYIVQPAGAPLRDPDLAAAIITTGTLTFTLEGATNVGITWVMNTPSNPSIDGTEANNWTVFTRTTQIIDGAGLKFNGLVLDVQNINPGASAITIAADGIGLDPIYLTGAANSGLEATGTERIRLAAQGFGLSGGAGSLLSVNTAALIAPTGGLGLSGNLLLVKLPSGSGLVTDASGLKLAPFTSITYGPGDASDWPSPPTTLQQALDRLADERSLNTHNHDEGGTEPQIGTLGLGVRALRGRHLPRPRGGNAEDANDPWWQGGAGSIRLPESDGVTIINSWPENPADAVNSLPGLGYVGGAVRNLTISSPQTITITATDPFIYMLRVYGDLEFVGTGDYIRVRHTTNNDAYDAMQVTRGENGMDGLGTFVSSAGGGGGGGGRGLSLSGTSAGDGGDGGDKPAPGGIVGSPGGAGGVITTAWADMTNLGGAGGQMQRATLAQAMVRAALYPAAVLGLAPFLGAGGARPGVGGDASGGSANGGNGGIPGGVFLLWVSGDIIVPTGTPNSLGYLSVSGGVGAQGDGGGSGGAGGGGGAGAGLMGIYCGGRVRHPNGDTPSAALDLFTARGGDGGEGGGAIGGGAGGGGGGGGGGIVFLLARNANTAWINAGGGAGGAGGTAVVGGNDGANGANGHAGSARALRASPRLVY